MRPILCLDFGSSNTKLALRYDPDKPSELLTNGKLSFDELNACVPSVAAVRKSAARTKWAFGAEAVDLKDGGQTTVYRNWKGKLFNPPAPADTPEPQLPPADPDDEFEALISGMQQTRRQLIAEYAQLVGLSGAEVQSAADRLNLTNEQLAEKIVRRGGSPRAAVAVAERPRPAATVGTATDATDYEDIACRFFTWLREFMLPSCLPHGVTKPAGLPVRVCLPEFDPQGVAGQQEPERQILKVLRKAGWTIDEVKPVISEPYANAIGVLTGGGNVTHKPKKSTCRHVHLAKMLTAGHFKDVFARRAPYDKDIYKALLIDIGAFTTDFALLDFTPGEMDAPPVVFSQSFTHGVAALDQACRGSLAAELMRVAKYEIVSAWELNKQSLYRAPTNPAGRASVEGVPMSDADIAAVRQLLRNFADEVLRRVNEFLHRHKADRIDELILTGGGNNIPLVAMTLADSLKGRGVRVVHRLSDDQTKFSRFHPLSPRLVRGGSALGGASLFFDEMPV